MSGSVEILIKKAAKFEKAEEGLKALQVLGEGIGRFPQNARLARKYDDLRTRIVKQNADIEPPKEVVKRLCQLLDDGKFAAAEKTSMKLLEVHPRSVSALNALGLTKMELGKDFEEAERCFKDAIKLRPDYVPPYVNLGNIFRLMGKIEESEEVLRRIIDAGLENPDAYNSLGATLEFKRMGNSAREFYEKALALDLQHIDARNNLGAHNFVKKDFANAWKLRESRWEKPKYKMEMKRFKGPVWRMEKVETLFVWAEQGVGDQIMFASNLRELTSFADNLVVSVEDKLIPLFERSFEGDMTFVRRHEDIHSIAFNAHAPAMTAFGYFRERLDQFKQAQKPYMIPCPYRSAAFRQELERLAKGRRIFGVSWFTKAVIVGKWRCVPLCDLVANIPEDVFLVNLQYGDVADDIRNLKRTSGRDIYQIPDLDPFEDLDGLAALISACDSVISVDNVTVHLAGSLGKNSNVLLPFKADWRWGSPSDNSSFIYGNMRLHRQQTYMDWSGSLASLNSSLF
jgi:Flp pilus assembly protein TadD